MTGKIHIEVVRGNSGDYGTNGNLSVCLDGKELYHCFTLEDPFHPVKIAGDTRIPAGTYVVTLTYSNTFRKVLPQILAVPGFDGIRIHGGNSKADTRGCILVGERSTGNGEVNTCAPAVHAIMDLLHAHGDTGTITVR